MVLVICLGMAGPTDVGEYLEAVNVATIEGAAVWIRIRTLLKLMGRPTLQHQGCKAPRENFAAIGVARIEAETFEPSLILESFRFVGQRNSADYSRALMSRGV